MRHRVIGAVIGLLYTLALPIPGAGASTPTLTSDVTCDSTTKRGWCIPEVESPGQEPGVIPAGDPGSPVPVDRTCFSGDLEVPCTSVLGRWNGSCYVQRADPQPSKDDPVWDGHRDDEGGVIMQCRPDLCLPQRAVRLPDVDCVGRGLYWAPSEADAPDPLALAERAVARMDFSAIDIGIVPHDDPDHIGLIGLPVWMWVENPNTSTTGPLTESVSAGGLTVTVEATMDRIDWDMGDGTTITCTGPGTPYEDSFGKKESPDCGHRYETQGDPHTVTATSYWSIQWQSGGEAGSLPIQELTATTDIRVGELQVLRQ